MIYVELFGSFKMYYYSQNSRISIPFPSKSGSVLAYILLNRNRPIPRDELLDTFWNDYSSNNPLNAFKGLLFRIRKVLNQQLGANEYIIEQNGSYQWNNEINIEVDAEVFSKLISKTASQQLSNSQKITVYESAINLYKSDFLCNVHSPYWIEITRGYYKALNIDAILKLIEYYKIEKDYSKIENLCVSSLKSHYMDEEIYYNLILAKIFLNKRQEAIEIYKESIEILKDELGIEHPEKLESLKEKISNLKLIEAQNIENICSEIESQKVNGTFICSYTVFCEICRLEYRKMMREEYSGQSKLTSRHVLLMTVFKKGTSAGMTDYILDNDIMKKIENIIMYNLRSGDVISQCNSSQFVFLLQGCTIENCFMISERIKKQLTHINVNIDCKIQYQRLSSGTIIT